MNERRGEPPSAGGGSRLEHRYEGEDALGALMRASGGRLGARAIAERFREAISEGGAAGEVIPGLWEGEPRFPSPELALRTYANLLGLWDRLAAGLAPEPAPEPAPGPRRREPAPAPEPPGEGPLPDAFVEAAWRYLADLPAREIERLTHRYENLEPDLSEFARLEAGEDAAADDADTLVFELWAMLDLARPRRERRAVSRADLAAAAGSSGNPEPVLDRYVDEAVAEAQLDDEAPLTEEQAARVRGIARTAVRAMAAIERTAPK